MTGNLPKTTTDDTALGKVDRSYAAPTLFVVGSATKLLQNTFSQRYREATSGYTTYWNN